MIPHRMPALLAVSLAALTGGLFAQDSMRYWFAFGEGVKLHGGGGRVVVRDDFISSEKYTGFIPLIAVSWSRFHETYGYRLVSQYQFTSKLRNNNVSSELSQFSIGLDFLYPAGKLSLLRRDVRLFLGPSAELFLHFRRQNIAGSGESVFNAYSVASLISSGIRSEICSFVTSTVQLRGSVQLSVLSLGGRFVDPRKTDESFLKLLTPFSGLHAGGELGVRYRVAPALIASAGYRLEVTRITPWDYFITAGDLFILGLSYDL